MPEKFSMPQFQLNLYPDQIKALYIGLNYLYHGEGLSLQNYFESWQSDYLAEVAIGDFKEFQARISYIIDEIVGIKGVMFLTDIAELQEFPILNQVE